MNPLSTCAFSAATPWPSSLRSLYLGSSRPPAQPRPRRARVSCSRPILRMASTNSTRPSDNDRHGNDVVSSTFATETYPDPQTTALSEWCVAHGIKMPKLRIRNSPFGRCLVATADILPSEAMIRVPAAMALAVDTRSTDPPPLAHIPLRAESQFWERASWEVRLGLVLLNEYRQGSNSAWAPYIDALPKEPSAALLALQEPHGPGMRAREQLARVQLLDVADAYCAHMHTVHAALAAALLPEAAPISPRELCWAVACAQSRAFGVPGGSADGVTRFAMFPGLDCGNHSARARCSFEFEEETGEFVVHAGFGVQEGHEAFLNYGTKTPGDLVLFYGFVEGGSPACSVPVGMECVWDAQDEAEEDGLRKRKDALLEGLGLADEDESFVLGLHDVDPRLMMALRVAVASEEDVAAMEEMEFGEGSKGFRSVGVENEVKAWKCVERHCELLMREVGPLEREFEVRTKSSEPYSLAWEWGADRNSPAEALLRFEKNRVLKTTVERVRHFRKMSEKIGIVCTVLMPPSQSMLKTDLFSAVDVPGGSGVHQFVIDAV